VDKVEDYVSSRAEVDGTMKSFQEMISYAEARGTEEHDANRCTQKIPVHGSQYTKAERRPG